MTGSVRHRRLAGGATAHLAAGAAVVALLAGTTSVVDPAAQARPRVESESLFRFEDQRINESSGLVDTGDVVFTTNDSGDGPYLYAVDPTSGDTVAVGTYADEDPVDVEALAPAADGAVWVGDIGDNGRSRGSIAVYRVERPGEDAPAARFELVYPDGSHDAETLLAHPRTGRLLVVTKQPLVGGTVYHAPARLREGDLHRLEPVSQVAGLVTDGAFFPDGRHVLLRTYGSAAVYRYPGFDLVGQVRLPRQRQGEGLSISPEGRILVSTEGVFSPVLEIRLPFPLREQVAGNGEPEREGDPAGGESTASPTGEAGPSRTPGVENPGARTDPPASREGGGVWIAAGALVVTFVGWLLFTASRPRSRRRR